jgi:hypothetical protein
LRLASKDLDFQSEKARSRRLIREEDAMKITVTLEASGGEIARETVEFEAGEDESEAISIAAQGVIEGWTLSIGDTIKIEEG